MLYEMVCGRPPFVGDESVAIIGQHLNTPPVAPSWHRPDCPPALEALILRLLEKDPSKRPASASRGASDAGVRSRARRLRKWGHAAERLPLMASLTGRTDNPLYRRTFVGRETELQQLAGGLRRGALRPGSAWSWWWASRASARPRSASSSRPTWPLRGGKALVGHCYEEGSLSLPYLAFVEAMRCYVLAREPDGLRQDLGTGAAEVARIVSEVRDRVPARSSRWRRGPGGRPLAAAQAVSGFLRNASTVQPLLLVLEDLHWADRGTLDLLLHVARNLQGARLLIVGTYRDVEVDRAHPLSGALAELRRGRGASSACRCAA